MPTISTVDATWDTGTTMDAAELRRADSAMFLGDGSNNGVRGGIVRHGDNSLAVTVNGSDQVTVQPGAFVVPAATGLGAYRGSLQAAVGPTGATALAARNATNPRIDLVVIQVGTGSVATLKTIDGTPSSSPVAPALPAQHIELARLNVPATGGGAVTVDSTWRAYATGLGGTLYVETVSRLPGSGNIKGQRAVSLATGLRYTWDGTTWGSDDEWTSYAISITNLPIDAATRVGRYKRDGKQVFVSFIATATGAGSGTLFLNLPLTAAIQSGTNNQSQMLGQAMATDTGVANFPAWIYLSNANTVGFFNAAGTGTLGTLAPFTWGAGDTLSGTFSYEAA